MQRRDVDVALIPSFEYLRHADYLIVSDACIGCRQRVMSVKLFADRPPAEIRSLALDEGSRTSAVLVQILLDRLHHVSPALASLPIGHGLDEARTDAVLLIGDRAINVCFGSLSTRVGSGRASGTGISTNRLCSRFGRPTRIWTASYWTTFRSLYKMLVIGEWRRLSRLPTKHIDSVGLAVGPVLTTFVTIYIFTWNSRNSPGSTSSVGNRLLADF